MGRLPLATLLSHALVAFTIELDNEFERQMPHRTTSNRAASRGNPWLVSLAMWSTCMRFVPDDGVTVRELERLARTPTNLNGMVRWGYVVVGPDGRVRPTAAGRRAQELWRALPAVIEERWEARAGKDSVDHLRGSLGAVAGQLDGGLPDSLPILGYGLANKVPPGATDAPGGPVAALSLADLLSRVLLAFALEYERVSNVSLAIGANVLRVLDDTAVRVRDLPRLAASRGSRSHGARSSSRSDASRSSSRTSGGPGRSRGSRRAGRAARARHPCSTSSSTAGTARFGDENASVARGARAVRDAPPTEPYAEGWRASHAAGNAAALPMVLHRGGFPDGA